MKLFTIGPVQMYKRTLEIKKNQVPYFRTQDFSNLMLDIDKKFRECIKTDKSSKIVHLTASGSAALEATVINCFSKNDKILVVNGGSFGARFSKICDIYDIPHTDIVLEFGEILDEEKLKPFENKGYTGFLVNLHETSTGQLYNISLISDFCKKNHITLVVDAITTFLADNYNMDEMGIDVTIVSSQKGLAISPGMAWVIINKKTIEERVIKINSKSMYFDFKDYLNNIERGQTPFTPAIGIEYELDDMLTYLTENNVESRVDEVANRALYFRELLKGTDFSIPSFPISNAITPVILPENKAKDLFNWLWDNYEYHINPCGGKNAERMIRISHVGDLQNEDYDNLLKAMKNFFKEN